MLFETVSLYILVYYVSSFFSMTANVSRICWRTAILIKQHRPLLKTLKYSIAQTYQNGGRYAVYTLLATGVFTHFNNIHIDF